MTTIIALNRDGEIKRVDLLPPVHGAVDRFPNLVRETILQALRMRYPFAVIAKEES